MATVNKGWLIIKHGILGAASGTTKVLVVQKNGVIKARRLKSGRRS